MRRKVEILSPANPHTESNSNDKKNLHLTRQAERALKTTFLEAKLFQSTSINTAHLLLCILRNENDPTTKLLNKMRIEYDGVKDQFKSLISNDEDFQDTPTSDAFPNEDLPADQSGKENLFTGSATKPIKNLRHLF